MKRTCLALSILALACAGWSVIPAWADKNGKFPGKGSLEAYSQASKIGNEAKALARKGDYESAIKLDKKSIAIYPFDSMRYHNLAYHLSKIKKFDEAITAEERALKIEPSFDGAWIRKGYCYEDSGRLNEAEKCYFKANSIDCSVESCVAIGNLLATRKKYSQARVWYGKAKSLTNQPSELSTIEQCIKELPPIMEASH